MIKLVLSGCNGRMGQVVTGLVAEAADMEIAAGIDAVAEKRNDYPVYAHPLEYGGGADVVVDFSSAAALEPLLSWTAERKIPLILCATGYSEEQLARIREAAKTQPIFKSANMSVGINLLMELVKRAASVLGSDFDVEIVEKHHKQKKDAPSGTALMLADAAKEGLPYEPEYVFDRSGVRQPRQPQEIGISAVRGGTMPGEHSVFFIGADEVIEFKHTVYSRQIFAAGALRAARFMAGVTKPGLYDMGDVLAAM